MNALRTQAGARRGFSLVEILIAILVLAFGLLGLAAIFPVVVTQQRDAADEMLGPAAVSAIEAQLFGGSDLVDWSKPAAKLASGPGIGAAGGDTNWDIAEGAVRTLPNGELRLIGSGSDREILPASSRLFPPAFGSAPPQFVWDVAVRRPDPDGPLEVGLFVRRLDTAIRVPEGKRLANVLTGAGMEGDLPTALPVAVDAASGRPTSNGVGDYAVLIEKTGVRPQQPGSGRPYDRFDVSRYTSLERALLARRGQQILDSHGVVRTIVDVDDDGRAIVEPAWPNATPVQILYAPQQPVAVRVVRVEVE